MIRHWLGLDDPSGPIYLFWSGFGADLPIFAGVAVFYARHRCHERRCLWPGLHRHPATGYVTCRKHAPRKAAP